MWPWLFYAFLGLNLFTFLAFGWDKRRARKNASRTPEGTLLTLSFLGGFPGGWIAMNLFRHKTRKVSFKLKMLAVSLVNPVWLVLWLLSEGRI
ncbi:MAG: DUF1294 domain-containing protein [Planctomycetota bacterium]